LTTDELEDTLFAMIVDSNLEVSDPRFLDIDEYFAGPEVPEDEFQHRCELSRLAALLGDQ
jgi:hypothetical protein